MRSERLATASASTLSADLGPDAVVVGRVVPAPADYDGSVTIEVEAHGPVRFTVRAANAEDAGALALQAWREAGR